MNSDGYLWLEEFVDRESDSKTISAAYERVRGNQRPNVFAILGDSGIGKTRLVTEFYRHLAQRQPVPYWPASLGNDLIKLDLNPTFDENAVPISSAAMPFLWWGVRFFPPDHAGRVSSSSSAFLEATPHLLGHFIAAERQAIAENDRVGALDLLLDVVLEFGLTAIPMVGLGKSVFTKAGENAVNRRKLERLKEMDGRPWLVTKERQDESFERLLEALSKVLSAGRSSKPKMPFVMVLDDVHWIDKESARQFNALFDRAEKEDWPLLVLTTAWSTDWDAAVSTVRPLADLLRHVETSSSLSLPINTLRLRPIGDPSTLAAKALPGVAKEHIDDITNRFQGDLKSIVELVRSMRMKRQVFEEGEDTGPLSAFGIRYLSQTPPSRDGLIQERFNDLPEIAKGALSVAAILGRQSLIPLVKEIVDELAAPDGDQGTPADPLAVLDEETVDWLFREPLPSLYEFTDEVIHAVAAADIRERDARLAEVVSTALGVVRRWIDDGRAEMLAPFQLSRFLGSAEQLLVYAPALQASKTAHIDVAQLACDIDVIAIALNGASGLDVHMAELVAESLIAGTGLVANLPLAWRSRCLARVSVNHRFLQNIGFSRVQALKQAALDMMRQAARSLRQHPDQVGLVEILAYTLQAAHVLSTAMATDENLAGEQDETDEIEHLGALLIRRNERLAHAQDELLKCIEAALRDLGHATSPSLATARAVLLHERHYLKRGSQPELAERLIASIEQIPIGSVDGERWTELLFRLGPMKTALFTWPHAPDLEDALHRLTSFILRSLDGRALEELGTYQLLALGAGMSRWVPATSESMLREQLARTFECYLHLIDRGMGDQVVDWENGFAEGIELEMGLHPIRLGQTIDENYLKIGWGALEERVHRLKTVSARCAPKTTAMLLGRLFGVMARQVYHASGPAALDDYLSSIGRIAAGLFHDVDLVARFRWMTTCLNDRSGKSQQDRRLRLLAAYEAAAGIPWRFFKLVDRPDRIDKIFHELFDDDIDETFQLQVITRIARLIIAHLHEDAIMAREDWQSITDELVRILFLSFTGAHAPRTEAAEQLKALSMKWLNGSADGKMDPAQDLDELERLTAMLEK